jgi:hypothetical protein
MDGLCVAVIILHISFCYVQALLAEGCDPEEYEFDVGLASSVKTMPSSKFSCVNMYLVATRAHINSVE